MLPEPPLAPDPLYVPKIIVRGNWKASELSVKDVRNLIHEPAEHNPIYRLLTNRVVLKAKARDPIPLINITAYLNPSELQVPIA